MCGVLFLLFSRVFMCGVFLSDFLVCSCVVRFPVVFTCVHVWCALFNDFLVCVHVWYVFSVAFTCVHVWCVFLLFSHVFMCGVCFSLIFLCVHVWCVFLLLSRVFMCGVFCCFHVCSCVVCAFQ